MTPSIKDFAGACKALKIKPNLPEISEVPKKHQRAIQAYYKLVIIIEALNGGWEPNWNNNDERKWEIVFDMENGFSFYSVYCLCRVSDVGSRLCFKSRELAEYCATKFISLWKDLYTFKKIA